MNVEKRNEKTAEPESEWLIYSSREDRTEKKLDKKHGSSIKRLKGKGF